MKFDNPTMALRAFMRALGMDPDTEHVQSITVTVSVFDLPKITVRRVVTKEQTPSILAGLAEIRPDAVVIDERGVPASRPVIRTAEEVEEARNALRAIKWLESDAPSRPPAA